MEKGINRYRIDKIKSSAKHGQFNACLKRVQNGVIGEWKEMRIFTDMDMQDFQGDTCNEKFVS